MFQTSSVLEFNTIFAQYACQQELQLLLRSTGIKIPVPNFEALFQLAEAKYLEMVA